MLPDPQDMLEEPTLREIPKLAEFVAVLEEEGVTADFTAGILFAARLMQDTTFDY